VRNHSLSEHDPCTLVQRVSVVCDARSLCSASSGDHCGAQDDEADVDLVSLVAADPRGLLATLDAEVLADVTAAAHIFAQRLLTRRAGSCAAGVLRTVIAVLVIESC